MKKIIFLLAFSFFASCSNDETTSPTPVPEDNFVRAADMSFIPEIEAYGSVYKNNGTAQDPLLTLKNSGCNFIRLRLWHTPTTSHSALAEVKQMATRVHNLGMKVWLTVHFSDTWADPGHQTKPTAWQSLSFTNLKTAVSQYMTTVCTEIQPDIIQIGNETNNGFLWPEGNLTSNEGQYLQLAQSASSAIRANAPQAKIMLHFAGISGADWFFGKVQTIDYDYIGISYYPVWHGTNLQTLKNTISNLGQTFSKKVLIAETAYPFTLNWNDWTNNIVGLENQLIPGYTASPTGQKNFLSAIKTLLKETNQGYGFCYWGGEWIAFKGTQATDCSSWENQALWDFNNNALPVFEAFNSN